MPLCQPSGPIPATVAIVGEAPGAEEERTGRPFVGASGHLLTKLLAAAGLSRENCFVTNVCRVRPPGNDISEWFSDNKRSPDPTWERHQEVWCHPHILTGATQLELELAEVQPKLIIALGNTALWALTGQRGIGKWRGSRLSYRGAHLVPALHPAAALRQSELVPIIQMDLHRAVAVLEGRQQPRSYSFEIEPDFSTAYNRLRFLAALPPDKPLSVDIETRRGQIACVGFAWSQTEAICIPLLRAAGPDPFYWPLELEVLIRREIARLLRTHPIIGQNFLYDAQYFHRHGMGLPARVFDTMIGHHSIYSTLRKGLDFLSSMYAHDHVYWKDESKNWDESVGERQYWTYNCKDACITYEVATAINAELELQA